jgi:hypothetical protein
VAKLAQLPYPVSVKVPTLLLASARRRAMPPLSQSQARIARRAATAGLSYLLPIPGPIEAKGNNSFFSTRVLHGVLYESELKRDLNLD